MAYPFWTKLSDYYVQYGKVLSGSASSDWQDFSKELADISSSNTLTGGD